MRAIECPLSICRSQADRQTELETLVIPARASSRPRVIMKKNGKAETAAFMLVAETPPDLMYSW